MSRHVGCVDASMRVRSRSQRIASPSSDAHVNRSLESMADSEPPKVRLVIANEVYEPRKR